MGRATGIVDDKIAELQATCGGLTVPQILALRRLVLADPETLRWASPAALNTFFAKILDRELAEIGFEALAQMAERGYAPLLPPAPEPARAEDRRVLEYLSRRYVGHHPG